MSSDIFKKNILKEINFINCITLNHTNISLQVLVYFLKRYVSH